MPGVARARRIDVGQVRGVDVEAHLVAGRSSRPCTPGMSVEALGRPLGLGDDRGAGELAQRVERPGLHGRAGPDDAHPVAQRLDLGEDVARQQHRAALVAHLLDAALEHRLHQRVEPRGRLVEDQQLGRRRRARPPAPPSGGCPSSRCGPAWSGRARTARSARRAAAGRGRPAAGRRGRSPRRRSASATASRRRARRRGGGAARPRRVHGSPPSSDTCAAVGPQQAEQHPDGRGLPGPVRSEEAVDLAGRHLEVQPVERAERPERLDQARPPRWLRSSPPTLTPRRTSAPRRGRRRRAARAASPRPATGRRRRCRPTCRSRSRCRR